MAASLSVGRVVICPFVGRERTLGDTDYDADDDDVSDEPDERRDGGLELCDVSHMNDVRTIVRNQQWLTQAGFVVSVCL